MPTLTRRKTTVMMHSVFMCLQNVYAHGIYGEEAENSFCLTSLPYTYLQTGKRQEVVLVKQ